MTDQEQPQPSVEHPNPFTIEVINPSAPDAHFVLHLENEKTLGPDRVVVRVNKLGRFGAKMMAFRNAATERPEWEEGRISFAGVSYEPTDVEEAERWMEAVDWHVDHASSPEPVSASAVQFQRDAFMEEFGEVEQRWQYAVVNTGSFNSPDRMAAVLGNAGRVGWELVTVYDKSSNWFQGMEKGFMLLRRSVPPGVEPKAWSIQFRGS